MLDEAPFTFQRVFNEEYLFVDPLLKNEGTGKLSGPVLLAEEIREYITKYGLLIANDFYSKNLKGASYAMRPAPDYKAWRFRENGEKVTLYKGKDLNHKYYYEVPPNSLVYIRLLQKLRLPYYIIGRFNLKVTYTYKGLLLGTGPQVDPGYEEYLNIPLHNFTESHIKIYLDKSFVSIDFVRTAPLQLGEKIPKSRAEFLDEKNNEWEELRLKLCPQPIKKLRRNEIEDYVEEERPSSFLGGFVPKLEENEKRINESLKKVDRRNYLNWGIMVALILALLTAIYMTYSHLDMKVENTKLIIYQEVKERASLSEQLRNLEQRIKDFQTEEKLNKTDDINMPDSNNMLPKVKNIQD